MLVAWGKGEVHQLSAALLVGYIPGDPMTSISTVLVVVGIELRVGEDVKELIDLLARLKVLSSLP